MFMLQNRWNSILHPQKRNIKTMYYNGQILYNKITKKCFIVTKFWDVGQHATEILKGDTTYVGNATPEECDAMIIKGELTTLTD